MAQSACRSSRKPEFGSQNPFKQLTTCNSRTKDTSPLLASSGTHPSRHTQRHTYKISELIEAVS